jgi:S-adenosylmethionine hydrolase
VTLRYNTISLLTDYGVVDESVGVVRSVIRSITPAVTVIDITHGITQFDVRAGAVALVRAANYMVPGVVIADVDAAGGRTRRAIAVEVGDGESVLIGPDNGLLAPIVNHVGGARRVVELTEAVYHLTSPAPTFSGRDVFAPSAAHLCAGIDLTELGPPIDPHDLVPAVIPFCAEKDGVVTGDVLSVDHYGNVHTNVSPEHLSLFQDDAKVQVSTHAKTAVIPAVSTFADVAEHEAAFLVDAAGLIAFVVNQGSAARFLGVGSGDTFTVTAALSPGS